jgi:hypothetical protein
MLTQFRGFSRDESIKPNYSMIGNFLLNKTKVLQCELNFNPSNQTPPSSKKERRAEIGEQNQKLFYFTLQKWHSMEHGEVTKFAPQHLAPARPHGTSCPDAALCSAPSARTRGKFVPSHSVSRATPSAPLHVRAGPVGPSRLFLSARMRFHSLCFARARGNLKSRCTFATSKN